MQVICNKMSNRKLVPLVWLLLLGASLVLASESNNHNEDNKAEAAHEPERDPSEDLGDGEPSEANDEQQQQQQDEAELDDGHSGEADEMVSNEQCVSEAEHFLADAQIPESVVQFLNGFQLDWEQIFREDGFDEQLFEGNGFAPAECNQVNELRQELFEQHPCTTKLDYTQNEVFELVSGSGKLLELTKANLVCVVAPHSDDNETTDDEESDDDETFEDASDESDDESDGDSNDDSASNENSEDTLQATGDEDQQDHEASDGGAVESDGESDDQHATDDNNVDTTTI